MSPSPSTRAPWEEGFLWGEGREGGKSCGGSEHLSAGFTPAQQPSKALSVSVFLVSVHVNTPPVLPSSRPPPRCVYGICVCPESRLLTSPLPIVSFSLPLPPIPSFCSNCALRPGSFRFGRQAWATGECHFSITLLPPHLSGLWSLLSFLLWPCSLPHPTPPLQ